MLPVGVCKLWVLQQAAYLNMGALYTIVTAMRHSENEPEGCVCVRGGIVAASRINFVADGEEDV